MPKPRKNDRNAVYFCQPGADFKPQRVWDFPQAITSANLYRKRLAMADAAGFARTHNAEQIRRLQRDRTPITEWAIVLRYLRPVHRRPRR